jgi:protein-L-isoaspartate(D-aspartate) O-methyltransferase
MKQDSELQRRRLIEAFHKAGVCDERVLAAITAVPREQFVATTLHNYAYSDRALPIGLGQTISQPLIVAIMTQALYLTGSERVLEIGTGSGYQTAVLARLARYVYSVERYPQLSYQAARRLVSLGVDNASLFIGDGSLGWPAEAPYDRILVTAAAPEVPHRLLEQLAPGGLLVIPVGAHNHQDLQAIHQFPWGTRVEILGGCIFVPLIGAEGWRE